MEFPDLGKHCNQSDCKQLDFLPFKCDGCSKAFCQEHRTYASHRCPMAPVREKRLPHCPLCDVPIPILQGEDVNTKVEEHILRGCKTKKIVNNKCNVAGCKQHELFANKCSSCQLSFCLRHRYPDVHNCTAVANGTANTRLIGPFRVPTAAPKAPTNGTRKNPITVK